MTPASRSPGSHYKGQKDAIAEAGRDPDTVKMLPMAYTVVGESRAHAEEREQVFLNDLVDPKASLTLLSELMNHDFSDMALEDPITDELIESVSGIRGLVQNLRKHIGGDTLTLADLAGHRATLLQGPRFVGTGPEVADQMQEWFEGDACDGFVIAATHVPGAYEDVVRLVVPELQRRGVFRDRYTGATLRENLGLRGPPSAADRTDLRGDMSAPLRVVQWATGNIGTRSLRAVIEHPGLELVGLHVHTEDKVGRDAGDLAGTDPTGVLATGSIEDVLALGADCVLYMPQGCDLDAVCRLLASGANIVTTRGEFLRPASMDPDERRRVEDACAAGGTSIHSTGSSPGFISEALPIVLLTMQRRLDRLLIDEFADMSSRNSPEMLFDLMAFGGDPAAFDARRFGHLAHAFGPSLSALADAIGLPLDAIESGGEVAVAAHDVEIAAGRWRRARSRRSDPSSRVCATASPCWSSGPTGTSRPTSSRRGTCGRPAGGCRSSATPPSTSRSGSPSSRSATPRCRPASRPTPRSTPWPRSARRRRASAPPSTSRGSCPTCADGVRPAEIMFSLRERQYCRAGSATRPGVGRRLNTEMSYGGSERRSNRPARG